jgi:hypothetical protein
MVSPANGGVALLGHTMHLRLFIDPDLLQWPKGGPQQQEGGTTTSARRQPPSCALRVA